MIFLTDVDEVLADFAKHVCAQAKVVLPENCGWEIFDAMTPEDRERSRAMVDAEGFCESLPVCDGSQAGIERLRSLGCKIIAVTSPWKRSKTWEYERRHWLEKHFNITDVISTACKQHVSGDFFLDDKPEHVSMWKELHNGCRSHGLLWDTPFNRNTGAYSQDFRERCEKSRIRSWGEVAGFVKGVDRR